MLSFLCIVQLSLVVLALVAFFFTRSSKKLPKNFAELKSEFLWQVIGIYGLVGDFMYRSRNHVDIQCLTDKVAVITGGNRGIGLRVVEKLLQCEMTVVMGVRNPKNARISVEKEIDVSQMKGQIYYEELDTGSMESVKKFAATVKERFSAIDILINNAGVMATPFKLTEDGFESQLAINYLGHFLLCHLLLPELKAAGTKNRNARIVNVSSIIHYVGRINFKDINSLKYYSPAEAYSQSKIAQVVFTKYLQSLLTEEGAYVQVHACHPGLVDTDLFVHSSTAYIPWFKKAVFKSPEEGSRTVVFAAISDSIENKGGSYLNNCTLVKTNSKTKNESFCKRVFEFTCNLLNIENFGKP